MLQDDNKKKTGWIRWSLAKLSLLRKKIKDKIKLSWIMHSLTLLSSLALCNKNKTSVDEVQLNKLVTLQQVVLCEVPSNCCIQSLCQC